MRGVYTQSLQSVLVLHAGTVAAVFGDTGGAEKDKLVQVSRGAHIYIDIYIHT